MSEGVVETMNVAAESIEGGVRRVEGGDKNPDYLSDEEVKRYYPDELMGVVGLNELIERITGVSGQTSRQGEQMWGEGGMGVLNPDNSKPLVNALLDAIKSAAEEHVRRAVAEGSLQEGEGRDLLELISQMYQHTRVVIDRAFRVMERESLIDVYPWLGNVVPRGAFLVPGRVGISRQYKSAETQRGTAEPPTCLLDRETVAHLPLTHLLDYDALVALLRLLPPIPVSCILSSDGRVVVVAWWVPIFPADEIRLLSERSQILEKTIRVLNRKGIRVFGLGATLPAFIKILTKKLGSEEGGVPKASEVAEAPAPIITTGHAGTTALVSQMVEEIISGKSGEEQKIGLFGLGNIGSAILKALVGRVSDITDIYVYDTKGLKRVTSLVGSIIKETIPKATVCVKEGEADEIIIEITSDGKKIQVHVAGMPTIVWDSCNMVISTATTPVEVPQGWRGIAIDDSQPPMLMDENVRWVVGEVPKGYVTRPVETWEIGGKSVPWYWGFPPGYNGYTETWGLADNKSAWGCLLEVFALMSLLADERREHAITGPVSLGQILYIEHLFLQLGIRPAKPQSRGRYLSVEKKTERSAPLPSP